MLKVMISYDMASGKEQECQEYLVNKLAPGLGRLGFRFSDVWFTLWGDAPQILGGGELRDMSQAQKIFQSDEWEGMLEEITPLTENFKLRVVQAGSSETAE